MENASLIHITDYSIPAQTWCLIARHLITASLPWYLVSQGGNVVRQMVEGCITCFVHGSIIDMHCIIAGKWKGCPTYMYNSFGVALLASGVVSPPCCVNGQFFYFYVMGTVHALYMHCTYHNVICASNYACALCSPTMRSLQLVVFLHSCSEYM